MLDEVYNFFKHATALHHIVQTSMTLRNHINKARMFHVFPNLWFKIRDTESVLTV
jgi:hypothetical protein